MRFYGLLAIVLILSACNAAQTSEEVHVQLKWYHQAQFAGIYTALEKGYYEQEGLNVILDEYQPQQNRIQQVVSGQKQFGVIGADELLIEREKGTPIIAVAVIYQKSPLTAYSLVSSNISSPYNFEGKTIGLQPDINSSYEVMMNRLNIDKDNIQEVEIGHDASELISGTVDVSTGYIMNEPHLAIREGYQINTILLADYGADSYADVIFTTEKMVRDNPNLVRRFVKATIQGWQYAVIHTDEALDATMKFSKTKDREHEEYMLKTSIPLINTGRSAIGRMSEESWQETAALLYDAGLIQSKETHNAYTNKFIDED